MSEKVQRVSREERELILKKISTSIGGQILVFDVWCIVSTSNAGALNRAGSNKSSKFLIYKTSCVAKICFMCSD